MNMWVTKNNYQVIKLLGGRSNVYLVTIADFNLIVDTGKSSSWRLLMKRLNQEKSINRKISYLVLTHSHFDHCQNAFYLKNFSGEINPGNESCQVIMHVREAEYALKGFTPLPAGTNFISKGIVRLGSMIGEKRFSFKPFSPDVMVNGRLHLDQPGVNIYFLETPGHSKGSLSVIVDDEIALVGDAMFGVFPNSVFPPFADNVQEMVESWQSLLGTGCRLFLPGHGYEIDRELLEKEAQKYSKRFS